MSKTIARAARHAGSAPAYWRFQIGFWLVYAAIGITINLLFHEYVRSVVILHILWLAVSIGLTHLFHILIDRARPTEGPLWRIAPLLTGGILVIALLQTALVVNLTATILPVSREAWTYSSIASLGWGMLLVTGIWTLVYLRTSEKHRQREREGQLQATATEAELRALEAQINPHFLFNCLNSIRALVAEDPVRAQDMITRLANIFRYNLRREAAHTVPLSAEVEVVSDYLALESVRFEDRLRVRFAITPAAEKAAVPAMLLQALVENALKHGIAPLKEGGDLLIRAEQHKGAIVIEVENSGRLEEAAGGGMGLANARERLRLLYHGRASLELSKRDGHVVAKVLIPAQA